MKHYSIRSRYPRINKSVAIKYFVGILTFFLVYFPNISLFYYPNFWQKVLIQIVKKTLEDKSLYFSTEFISRLHSYYPHFPRFNTVSLQKLSTRLYAIDRWL